MVSIFSCLKRKGIFGIISVVTSLLFYEKKKCPNHTNINVNSTKTVKCVICWPVVCLSQPHFLSSPTRTVHSTKKLSEIWSALLSSLYRDHSSNYLGYWPVMISGWSIGAPLALFGSLSHSVSSTNECVCLSVTKKTNKKQKKVLILQMWRVYSDVMLNSVTLLDSCLVRFWQYWDCFIKMPHGNGITPACQHVYVSHLYCLAVISTLLLVYSILTLTLRR